MRMLKETLCVLLWASLEATQSRGCSSFFCRKSHRVSMLSRGADPGKPLFLTPYLEKGNIEEARKQSLVGPLPGANVKSYAGYLTVNKKYNSNLYFWFFPAQEWPETAPVLLWLQGGPGGTSMFGLFVEHGPYVVLKNLTVGYRDYPWTSRYSVLYIDNPVGTGFSFTDDDRGFAQNQDDVGRDLYSALTQFFQIFSEYQSNDFYATGESYAGKYVPAIGYYIHKHNPIAKVKINFKGVAIGDGLCDPELMLGGYGDFLYQTGLIDLLQKQYVEQQTASGVQLIQQEKWVEAFEVFDSLLNGDILPYPSFFHCPLVLQVFDSLLNGDILPYPSFFHCPLVLQVFDSLLNGDILPYPSFFHCPLVLQVFDSLLSGDILPYPSFFHCPLVLQVFDSLLNGDILPYPSFFHCPLVLQVFDSLLNGDILPYPSFFHCPLVLQVFDSLLNGDILPYPSFFHCPLVLQVFDSLLSGDILPYPSFFHCPLVLQVFDSLLSGDILPYPSFFHCPLVLQVFDSLLNGDILPYPSFFHCPLVLQVFDSLLNGDILPYPSFFHCPLVLQVFDSLLSGDILPYPSFFHCPLVLQVFDSLLNGDILPYPSFFHCPLVLQVFDSLLNGDILPYPSFFQNATGCTNYFNYLQCQVGTQSEAYRHPAD
ncbi:probable serine carboxypeptidase CPVL isoform X5 [Oncorhynchus keta]|uniref:probable serine carboxypeptidase CPVL isoform X5 n=1 Tax=Oncorhynchus keta TaxID=8018 RepID=UPI00227BF01D|nr:probable serine carboxypeptidase CPVL isoform X5 [Oncorhynchus keta]